MKKLILSVYLLSIVAFYGYSQSITLSNIHGNIAPNSEIIQAGTPDSSELITYLNVKNTGVNTIKVLCKKVELSMLDSTEMSMCWAGGCYPSGTNISPNDQSIAPGQTITEFSGHYTQIAFNHFKSGESVVRWVFFDRANPNDSVSVTVKYTSYPLGIEDSKGSRGVLSNIFPNPAAGDASCSYSVPSGARGSVVIRDIIGSTVQTQLLPDATGRINLNTMNLGDGVYFCSLLVDGKVSQTKKLIVKH
jgi:hypothetical protein